MVEHLEPEGARQLNPRLFCAVTHGAVLCALDGRIQVDSDLTAEHPPAPVRIEYALLFVEMWCREVAGMTTEWMTAGYLSNYFAAASRLFPGEHKRSWNDLISWLKSSQSEEYRSRIRSGLNRIRTGQG